MPQPFLDARDTQIPAMVGAMDAPTELEADVSHGMGERKGPSRAGRFEAAVLESTAVGGTFHRLRLMCAPIARGARAGQFIHVLPQIVREEEEGSGGSSFDPLLRRAFSIMSVGQESVGDGSVGQESVGDSDEDAGLIWFEILFRVGGRGTSLLARCRPGDRVDVLGPLGNGFPLDKVLREGSLIRPLFLVGGGIGVPPLIFAAQVTARSENQAKAISMPARASVSRETLDLMSLSAPVENVALEAFVGARSGRELVGVQELEGAGAQVHVATDDGSQGQRGLVTELLQRRLRELHQNQQEQGLGREAAPLGREAAPLVCACGPWPMLKAVARVCEETGVECWVSLEENMPCGVGVCNGCVVPVRGAADDYGRFQRICVNGPVLDASLVDWGEPLVSALGPSQVDQALDEPHTSENAGASQ